MNIVAQGMPFDGNATRTTCPYCGVGCGVLATPREDGSVGIAGDPEHPANFGKLCVKGSALGETLGLHGRLLHPQIDGQRVSWDAALDRVAQGFSKAIAEHGPDSVAFYVSGQLLTEDYYVANKLMKGFIGSANIDTNSRLCMSSAVAGYVRAFGEDVVPCDYCDLETADLIVLTGANLAWCHPILFQRIAAARAKRPAMKLVVIDPRRTATCEGADLHLAIRPGTDVWLFDGLLRWLNRQGAVDGAFVESHTNNLDAALEGAAVADDPAVVARECGIDEAQLLAFYQLFAATEKTVTAFSMGVNQSSAGTDKVNAIINVHLLSGRIGRAGMGPFSITGQPNAMGGREVGGLANMLAAHRKLEDPAHRDEVQAFWRSPAIASKTGLKAVDLFEAVEAGRIKALWIMATNPVVSLPNADQVRRALSACPLVVVSDCVAPTDTSAFAHVLLPATGWSEKDGTVTNTERRISRQRGFVAPPGEARHDWQIICEVARRMGFAEAFAFESAAAIFDEHVQLANGGTGRALDLSGLAGMSMTDYEALPPVQWPVPANSSFPRRRESSFPGAPSESEPDSRRSENDDGSSGSGAFRPFAEHRYSTPDRRARFVATSPRAPINPPDAEFPLILNTGRVRDHWHTMTRTGRSPRLAQHIAEPFVEVHPDDAGELLDGALARISTRWGSSVLRVRISAGARRGVVFAPIHWSAQFASSAGIGAAVNPAVDAVSGEPEFKHTPVRLEAFAAKRYGFVMRRGRHGPASGTPELWWARATGVDHTHYTLAWASEAVDEETVLARFVLPLAEVERIDFVDRGRGVRRSAWLVDGRLEACGFLGPEPALPAPNWLVGLFARPQLDLEERRAILAARPARAAPDDGPLVCSCFAVPRGVIERAIAAQRLTTAAQVTACVKAGGNCGSCVPEVQALLRAAAPVAATV